MRNVARLWGVLLQTTACLRSLSLSNLLLDMALLCIIHLWRLEIAALSGALLMYVDTTQDSSGGILCDIRKAQQDATMQGVLDAHNIANK